MVTPGAWYVELDDGTGADRRLELPGSYPLVVGEVLEAHGMSWRLVDVQPLPHYARAELVTDDLRGHATPPTGRG